MRFLSRALVFAGVMAGLILPSALHAQVIPAIRGGGSQINVYGLYSIVKNDGTSTQDYPPGTKQPSFLNSAGWNQAFAFGGDFRLGKFFFGQPALGARATFSFGSFADENTYLFGPELHYTYNKFRPYGNFLIGKGTIKYHGGFNDDSVVYDFGGGVDYHLQRKINIRLIDLQYQLWDLSTHQYPANLAPGQPPVKIDTTLKPFALSFGVTYRVR